MRSLDECTCSCHQTGAVHIVACCTGVSKYGIPAIKPYASGGIVDVHAYRKAIHDDCIIGTCSMNNCLYPSCAKEPKPYGIVDDVITDKPDPFALKTGEQILADINAAFEAEFGALVKPRAHTPEERMDIERYYEFIGQQMKGSSNV